ncbi:glycoside hydrolase family 16 protein [Actinocorallia sp. API 0066]|uniref:glycoside hydrolase family 16 protein n=1 Tax=Actinocorallia sp. API 0066 TaxID=2896846 RepID=UPI001E65C947|nr:glycoside hydrolase family 16 protein [Actinocorallia sp. API 0066]MCD0450138.1 glycoside hydrolase family 16 protein [Actinocorallia sp. API 0066]
MSGVGKTALWRVAAALAGALALSSAVVALQPGEPENAAAIPTLLPEQPAKPKAEKKPVVTLPDVKWKLSFQDEFDGTGHPSPGRWNIHHGNGINGYGHKALQFYHPDNVKLNGKGQLVLTARKVKDFQTCWYGPCTYTSGRIDSKGLVTHSPGRLTARMKIPKGKGLWPAFWAQTVETKPKRYSEIDILETIGSEPTRVQGFAHTAKGRVGGGDRWLDEPLADKYHVYGVDWTDDRIVWWMDGEPYAEVKRYPGWPFDTTMFFIFNLQVGGEWPGDPDAETEFPALMLIDWIRTYHPAGAA